MIRAVRWCISALLLLLAWQVHADARNVIVFFINGANQAGLEFARAAGADFAGLSNLSAFPVRGTLLPLTGEYRHLPLAAANAVALGKPADDAVGTLSSGEELDSLATLAKQSGRRVGIISDSLLTGWLPGAFYAHEPGADRAEMVANWLPLCDFNVLAGEVPSPDGRSAGDRLGDTMARIGYRNVLDVKNLTPPVSRLFIRHTDSAGRRYAMARRTRTDRERLIDYTATALECLENRNGFLLVAECGNIAPAGVENDASMLLGELWTFDRALGKALDFFKAAPEDTLIVVVSLYDAGELRLTGEPDTDFPFGRSRLELLCELNREPRTFGQALALLGAGELFAPGAEQLRELQRLYFDAPRLMEPQVLAGMRGFWNYEPDTVMRDYREWIDRLQDLRDRHYGAGFFSKRPAAALTPVWAIGAGAKEFAGEYSPEELHGKLRRALGLAPEPR
ncbi:MAG: hypothetical protein HP002_10570 [Lentisphaeria bacterium]|nr:hypothetical protein [Lentisphaeria bacterium]